MGAARHGGGDVNGQQPITGRPLSRPLFLVCRSFIKKGEKTGINENEARLKSDSLSAIRETRSDIYSHKTTFLPSVPPQGCSGSGQRWSSRMEFVED